MRVILLLLCMFMISFLTSLPQALGQPSHDTDTLLENILRLHQDKKYIEALPLARRYVEVTRKLHGKDHPDYATALHNLGGLYSTMGRFSDALPLLENAIRIFEKSAGSDDPFLVPFLHNLAVTHHTNGNLLKAEQLYRRSLLIYEKKFGNNHPLVSLELNALAAISSDLRRDTDAESLWNRAIDIQNKLLGHNNVFTAQSLHNLATFYFERERYGEAKELVRPVLEIYKRQLGETHEYTLSAMHSLANIYDKEGNHEKSEQYYKRILKIYEKNFGSDSLLTAPSLESLAVSYFYQSRFEESEHLVRRSLAIHEKTLGSVHPHTASNINLLASIYFRKGEWGKAVENWRRNLSIFEKRKLLYTKNINAKYTETGKDELSQGAWRLKMLLKSLYHLRTNDAESDRELALESFKVAQWVNTSLAAASLNQMSIRHVKDSVAFAKSVRERQDLIEEWQALDKQVLAVHSQSPDKRNEIREQNARIRLKEIDDRIAVLENRLKKEFPEYSHIATTEPLSVKRIQESLDDDEALILFLNTEAWKPTPEETFIWIVTKTKIRWERSALGSAGLKREVEALRCGLDEASWDGNGAVRCSAALNIDVADAPLEGDPLPFDLNRAHKLYEKLFGEVKALIKDKELLIVPSGALTKLPFQVLLTQKPDPTLNGGAANKDASWLVKHHNLTILPTVSSLYALRKHAKKSKASKPLIGFGNPLLTGNKWEADRAKAARMIESCASSNEFRNAILQGSPRAVTPLGSGNSIVDLEVLKAQSPLPETANELCAVARAVKADVNEIYLGARATESELKKLNNTGKLLQFKIIHFATHGTLAGELAGTKEPGLILSPPEKGKANEIDDGYLSSSEIMNLKLDADWVILSACNTAGSDTKNAEALSGLARAFFFAGARSLLVTHWYVDSNATVKLIKKTFNLLFQNEEMGQAHALRLAMLSLIDSANELSHPSAWAPFILVGEGAN